MVVPTFESARAMRDGGIHAVAALDFALANAVAGLSAEQAQELKCTFGGLMGEIVEHIINPAVQKFPDLTPEKSEWTNIVTEHSARLSARSREEAINSARASSYER